jgi:hypothetical protein
MNTPPDATPPPTAGKLDPHGQPNFWSLPAIVREIAKTSDYFVGLCRGILADGVVTPDEVITFRKIMLAERDQNPGIFDSDIILRRVFEIARALPTAPDAVTEEVCTGLATLLSRYTGITRPTAPLAATAPAKPPRPPREQQAERAPPALVFTDPPPPITIPGKVFVITGKLLEKTRSQYAEEITRQGGEVADSIKAEGTDYLIIGGLASAQWLHTNYGRKIQTAVEKGVPIVTEESVTTALQAAAPQ